MESKLFLSIEDWTHHMTWQHTTLYSCQFVGHEGEFFPSREKFVDHLTHNHMDSIPNEQLDDIVSKGARPAPDVMAVLAVTLALCPFCNIKLEDFGFHPNMKTTDMASSRFPPVLPLEIRNHVAAHLESIAFISLRDRDPQSYEQAPSQPPWASTYPPSSNSTYSLNTKISASTRNDSITMAPPPQWIWDQNHQEYRHYDTVNSCWVFGSGKRVSTQGAGPEIANTGPSNE